MSVVEPQHMLTSNQLFPLLLMAKVKPIPPYFLGKHNSIILFLLSDGIEKSFG